MPGGRSGSECALDRRIEPDRRVSPAFTLPPGAWRDDGARGAVPARSVPV